MTIATIYTKEQNNLQLPWIKEPKPFKRVAVKFNGKMYSSFVGYDVDADLSKCVEFLRHLAITLIKEEKSTLKIFEMSKEELALYKYSGLRIVV